MKKIAFRLYFSKSLARATGALTLNRFLSYCKGKHLFWNMQVFLKLFCFEHKLSEQWEQRHMLAWCLCRVVTIMDEINFSNQTNKKQTKTFKTRFCCSWVSPMCFQSVRQRIQVRLAFAVERIANSLTALNTRSEKQRKQSRLHNNHYDENYHCLLAFLQNVF